MSDAPDRNSEEGPEAGGPDADPEAREGTVVRRSSDHAQVVAGEETFRCVLRGRMRESGETVVVGDRVLFRTLGTDEGVIEDVLPRKSILARRSLRKGDRAYAANIDQVLVVASAAEPKLRPSLVDRILIAAERDGLDPVICLNKIDLDPKGQARAVLAVYRDLGYRVIETSVPLDLGFEGSDGLRAILRDRSTILTGHSGVGKSSILNALIPGLALRVGEVSRATAKGKHATTEVSLIPLSGGGFVVDTPGFREFAIGGLALEEIGRYYPEFRPYIPACRYKDCLHAREPGCAVQQAVERGEIPALRFRNYLSILRAERSPHLSPGERFKLEADDEQGIDPESV